MDLGPKSPSNELQRMSWKTRLQLIKQTFEWIQMLKERKGKGFVLESIVLGKIRGGLFLYIVLDFSYKFDYRMFQCFFPPPYFCCLLFLFISSPPLVRTSHVYIKGLVLIFVPSAPSISLHVVAVRLKHTVQVSPPH